VKYSRTEEWTLDHLLDGWVSETLPSLRINGLSLDSRLVSTPQGLEQFAGTVEALRSANIPVFAIDNIEEKCADIASRFYGHPDRAMTLVAVTGTDGKTSVCRFIAQAFRRVNRNCGYIGTLGWGIGEQLDSTELRTPDVVSLRKILASMRDQGAQIVALEASSHGLSEGRLKDLSIDVAVLTNLGRDHLDYHQTLEAYQAAKAKLFAWPGLTALVLNSRDEFGCQLFKAHSSARRFIYQAASKGNGDGNHALLLDSSTDGGEVVPVSAKQVRPQVSLQSLILR